MSRMPIKVERKKEYHVILDDQDLEDLRHVIILADRYIKEKRNSDDNIYSDSDLYFSDLHKIERLLGITD